MGADTETLQRILIMITGAVGIFSVLYGAAPKAWRTLAFLNRGLERLAVWINHSELVERLDKVEQRVAVVESRIRPFTAFTAEYSPAPHPHPAPSVDDKQSEETE